MDQLSTVGYEKNIFPFNESELKILDSLSDDVKNLELHERKNIFSINSNLRQIVDEKLNDINPNYQSTNYCFYIEKNLKNNWPLALHQDLNFPEYLDHRNPKYLVEHGFWFRINLDESDKESGALKVVPKSHITSSKEDPIFLENKRGELILFQPLLFHGSNKMKSDKKRRIFQILCQKIKT